MKKNIFLMAIAAIAMISCGPKAAPEQKAQNEEADAAVIRINCPLKVTPENRDKVLALCKELVDSSRTDAGNIDYDIYESATDPASLIIFETWQDQPSLDAHMAAPHFTRLVPQIQEASEMAIQVMTEKPQEGKPLRINCMLDVPQENREAAIELYKVHVSESLKDDGVIDFDLYLSATNPEKMMIFETWKNEDVLEAHATAEHSKNHIAQIKDKAQSKLEKFLLPEE
ncbi:MAG: antibiotic biosynthesis monooxygenase [Prevotella sp.]|nr:antibiotic biosynthesis monooxygenase [Prevotella sp.]